MFNSARCPKCDSSLWVYDKKDLECTSCYTHYPIPFEDTVLTDEHIQKILPSMSSNFDRTKDEFINVQPWAIIKLLVEQKKISIEEGKQAGIETKFTKIPEIMSLKEALDEAKKEGMREIMQWGVDKGIRVNQTYCKEFKDKAKELGIEFDLK